ncbi:MAG: hypothetical protein CVV05_01790 [Gammaproteobacteria bacterium HGW-Gammaproteobacteria-1]|jgi:hypothetical protein|nr:MAG: hypothetical protein CVV05_01790 [Gammaproteobacteria bacterium HGW-Gammaproteobacteria-1]
MKTTIHAAAGITAFVTILLFFSVTLAVELGGDAAAVAQVKGYIVRGLWLLIPALMLTGASGFALARGRVGGGVAAKKRRMPFIAGNGLLILLPAALLLDRWAAAGSLDGMFYAVQALELLAGATNLVLIGLNIRDGIRLRHGRS